MKKSNVLDLLRDQPEELDLERLIVRLWVRRKTEHGLVRADADEEMPYEQVDREIFEWLMSE